MKASKIFFVILSCTLQLCACASASDKYLDVVVLKNGNVSSKEIDWVVEVIGETFQDQISEIIISNDSMPNPPRSYPDRRYNGLFSTYQYLTKSFYDVVEVYSKEGINGTVYVLVTDKSLYPGEGWNFVFGECIVQDIRVAVVSTWFIKRRSYDELDVFVREELYERRLKYIAAHEVGHCLTLVHVKYDECLMAFGASMEQLDSQISKGGMRICDEGRVRLENAEEMIPCENSKGSFIRFRDDIRIYPECMLRIYGNDILLFSILVFIVYGVRYRVKDK